VTHSFAHCPSHLSSIIVPRTSCRSISVAPAFVRRSCPDPGPAPSSSPVTTTPAPALSFTQRQSSPTVDEENENENETADLLDRLEAEKKARRAAAEAAALSTHLANSATVTD
jgi:hypothetical protein